MKVEVKAKALLLCNILNTGAAGPPRKTEKPHQPGWSAALEEGGNCLAQPGRGLGYKMRVRFVHREFSCSTCFSCLERFQVVMLRHVWFMEMKTLECNCSGLSEGMILSSQVEM